MPASPTVTLAGFFLLVPMSALAGGGRDYPIRPVPFTSVKLKDGFWLPRLETNRRVTVAACFRKCEETGRIDNFAKAGGLMEGPFRGIRFDDSDVFKVIEGAAYSLALHPDPELDRYLDGLIAKIAAAQEKDGYLYTTRTIDPANPARDAGPTRWSYLAQSHELYNAGHLYEAAVAHHRATEKRPLLDVALRNADLVDNVFRLGKHPGVPGHEEIEIGLVKLYRQSGEKRYLDLAKHFIDRRGRGEDRQLYGEYAQDHKPVIEQDEPVGHSVRAGYLYAGMADVAAIAGEDAYVRALDRIWERLVSTKLYITGGIGAEAGHEGFGSDYSLPNATAYNETCAAIANALWNHRMSLLHADASYADVLELILYNGFLAGVGLSGDEYFYPNPLAFDGSRPFNMGSCRRSRWFDCACCPVNIVRFLPSLPGYLYAVSDDAIYVNLYAASAAEVQLAGGSVKLTQETRYPWDGEVRLTVEPQESREFAIHLRLPGWTEGRPVPSDLYRAAGPNPPVSVAVSGQRLEVQRSRGYLTIHRRWQPGEVVTLELPMPVRRVAAHDKVKEDAGRTALMRGPIVYCLEAVDHGGSIRNLWLPDDAQLVPEHRPDLLGGVTVLRGKAMARGGGGEGKSEPAELTAIPYHVWSHRELGEMEVWIPRQASLARPRAAATIASASRARASHVWGLDSLAALNDQLEPRSSNDEALARFTWWDHRGTSEWVEYEFQGTRRVSAVEVYWFDDSPRGGCCVPASWRLLYRDGGDWRPVEGAGAGSVEKDRFNKVAFDPVTATGLRIEVQLQAGRSGGILEWKVE